MKITTSDRGFRYVTSPSYTNHAKSERLISESSAIGEYEDALDNPGSSYLWIDSHHHLNREEVRQLIGYLQYWLEHKHLPERLLS
jgi:hypothetical protein